MMDKDNRTSIALMQQDITYIKQAIDEMREERKLFVTEDKFWPVKTLVYGFTAAMLTGVVGYWVSFAIKPF